MLAETVREAARRFGDRTAFVAADDPDDVLTYAELDARSDAIAVGLQGRGVGPGDVVAVSLPTSPTWPLTYTAIAKCGAVTAGVNQRLTGGERTVVVERAHPALVLEDPAEIEALEADGRGAPAAVVATGVADPIDPDRPVAICFTSGSTGVPKGAVFARRQLAAITSADVGEAWGGGGPSLAGTTFAHLGPMTKLPGVLRRGGTVHLLQRWSAARALELVAELRLPVIAGIPTQVALMLDALERHPTDVRSVQMVVIGGGPASPALVRRIRERFGVPVCARYACTEAGIGLGTEPQDPSEDAEVSVGRPRGEVELAIRDADGDVSRGEIGRVLLRSPAVMSGYHRDPEATRASFTRDGFVETGDLGWVDDQGRLRLQGRSSERYVRGGENVHPQQVEAVLAEHPAVGDVVVVGTPDDTWGEVGVAVVVPRGDAPTLAELRAHASHRLAGFKLPERLLVVDRLPLTANHKVDRRALAARVSAVPPRGPGGLGS